MTDEVQTALGDESTSFEEFERLRNTPAATPEEVKAETTDADSETAKKEDPAAKAKGEKTEEEKAEAAKAADEKKKGGFQRRIDKLTKEKGDLERQLEEARKLAEKPAVATETKSEAKTESGEPREDDFDSFADYTRALTKWTFAEEKKADAEAAAKAKAEADAKESASAAAAKVESFQKEHPDYEDVLDAFPDDVVFPEAVVHAISKSDNPPALLYALAKDVDLARQVAESTDLISAAKAIGKLEDSLSTEAQAKVPPKAKPATSAPRPVATVKGASGQLQSEDDEPYEVWEAKRNAHLAKRR